MGHSPNQQAQNLTIVYNGGIGGVTLFSTAAPHTLYKNQPVILGGTTAPTGFTLGTTYYVCADQNYSDTTFALSATPSGTPITASTNGTAVTVGMPTGTYRVVRIKRIVEEQWLTGQGSASAAKIAAKNPAGNNQTKFWQFRHVYQYLGNPSATVPYEDEFEYIVSAIDDGT